MKVFKMAEKCELAVVIASHNRPDDLYKVLTGLAELSFLPEVAIICDSSDEYEKHRIEEICRDAAIRNVLVHTDQKSLTRQKNMAIEFALKNFEPRYIQILDDDTVPDRDYTQILSESLRDDSVIGAGGAIYPYWSSPTMSRLKFTLLTLAGLDSRTPGVVTRTGVGIPVDFEIHSRQPSQWLFGCSMWKATIFEKVNYDAAMQGSCLCEDVEFSIRASAYGDLIVDPRAHLTDLRSMESRLDELYFYRFVRNRLRVISLIRKWNSYPMFAFSVVINLMNAKSGGVGVLRALTMTARACFDQLRNRPLR